MRLHINITLAVLVLCLSARGVYLWLAGVEIPVALPDLGRVPLDGSLYGQVLDAIDRGECAVHARLAGGSYRLNTPDGAYALTVAEPTDIHAAIAFRVADRGAKGNRAWIEPKADRCDIEFSPALEVRHPSGARATLRRIRSDGTGGLSAQLHPRLAETLGELLVGRFRDAGAETPDEAAASDRRRWFHFVEFRDSRLTLRPGARLSWAGEGAAPSCLVLAAGSAVHVRRLRVVQAGDVTGECHVRLALGPGTSLDLGGLTLTADRGSVALPLRVSRVDGLLALTVAPPQGDEEGRAAASTLDFDGVRLCDAAGRTVCAARRVGLAVGSWTSQWRPGVGAPNTALRGAFSLEGGRLALGPADDRLELEGLTAKGDLAVDSRGGQPAAFQWDLPDGLQIGKVAWHGGVADYRYRLASAGVDVAPVRFRHWEALELDLSALLVRPTAVHVESPSLSVALETGPQTKITCAGKVVVRPAAADAFAQLPPITLRGLLPKVVVTSAGLPDTLQGKDVRVDLSFPGGAGAPSGEVTGVLQAGPRLALPVSKAAFRADEMALHFKPAGPQLTLPKVEVRLPRQELLAALERLTPSTVRLPDQPIADNLADLLREVRVTKAAVEPVRPAFAFEGERIRFHADLNVKGQIDALERHDTVTMELQEVRRGPLKVKLHLPYHRVNWRPRQAAPFTIPLAVAGTCEVSFVPGEDLSQSAVRLKIVCDQAKVGRPDIANVPGLVRTALNLAVQWQDKLSVAGRTLEEHLRGELSRTVTLPLFEGAAAETRDQARRVVLQSLTFAVVGEEVVFTGAAVVR